MACIVEKNLHGPAAYHDCLDQQLRALAGSSLPQRKSSSATSTEPTAPQTAGCAENGSCYGDLNANGVPKTVQVNGYNRKDGTYVKGYYRSAPGTNPPKK